MKIKWKLSCLAAILVLDVLLGGHLYHLAAVSQETIFSPDSTGNEAREKLVALTFDDGPHPVYTQKLLDGLKKRGVHATFFLLGKSIDGNETLIQQMQEDGHLIGNHGYSHVQLSKESVEKAGLQIEETNEKIFNITGKTPDYIRPPFGSWSEELGSNIHMTVVLWNIDPLDWKQQNSKKVVKHILKNVEPNDIILLHDVFDTSVEAALEIVDTLSKQGYTFVTVDELLVD